MLDFDLAHTTETTVRPTDRLDRLADAFLAALEAEAVAIKAIQARTGRGKHNPLEDRGVAMIARIAELVEHPYRDLSSRNPAARFADRIAAWRAAYDK